MTRALETGRTSRVSVDEHISRVLGLGTPTPELLVDLRAARGCVLARDVSSPMDLPSFDNAAMDGYAVCAQDLARRHGVLPVCGEIPAGRPLPTRLVPGTAARIMTGAPVPEGADTVVQVEWTDAGPEIVTIRRMPAQGDNIRRAAHELRRGAPVLSRGAELTPARLALLAAVGVQQVHVHRRPRVAVLTTGTELVAPGSPLSAGGVYDANGTLLASLLDDEGAIATVLPCHPDDPDRVLASLLDASVEHDLVLTAGGISAGAYEVVREALAVLGTVVFDQVAITPGRPQGHGLIGATPVLTLPGNPTAALVSYLAFGRPLLQRCRGATRPVPVPVEVVIGEPIRARRDATRFVPASMDRRGVGGPVARALGGAHHLTSFADAEVLLRIDPDNGRLEAGDVVPALVV